MTHDEGRRAGLLLVAMAGLSALASACGGAQGESGAEQEALGAASQAETCLTIQNQGPTVNQVEDSQIITDPSDPTKASTNYGAVSLLNTGYVSTDVRRILLRFNLDAAGVPSDAVVTSATMDIRLVQSPGKKDIDIRAGTLRWDEATVTWNVVAASPNGGIGVIDSVLATFGVPNNTILHVPLSASLVQSWVNPATNYGLVLDHPTSGRTSFVSSEGPVLGRPALALCYALPSCNDTVQNQGETGVDCGGPCSGCLAGGPCLTNADCAGGVCTGNVCGSPATCSDSTQNQGETGIDCGGPNCAACADGQGCATAADCMSGYCLSSVCATPSCNDLVQNAGETGVDCGGPACPGCANGQGCLVGSDCASGACVANVCVVPNQCNNGIQDAGEAGLDCGGSCAPCGCVGAGCTTHLLSKSFVTNQGFSRGGAADAAGNLAMTGLFRGSMSFGGATLTNSSALWYDVYVAKLDAAGNHLWSKKFGDAANSQGGTAIAYDPSGNVVVAGFFSGTINLGGSTLTGTNSLFIAKLSAAGAHMWSRSVSPTSSFDSLGGTGTGLAVDSAGNVFVASHFFGSADFGGGLIASAGLEDLYVAKYDSNGAYLWARRFGDSQRQLFGGIGVDGSGNAIITGAFGGTLDFGNGPMTALGNRDMFAAKLDSAGNVVWAKHFGDSNDQYGEGVAVTPSGESVYTGVAYGNVDFGGGPLNAGELFVAKLSPDGDHVYSERFHSIGSYTTNPDISVDAAGNAIMTDNLQTIDFGGGTLFGSYQVAAIKFDAGGRHVWSRMFGDLATMTSATDAAGNVLLFCDSSGALDFGGGSLPAGVFVAKLAP